MRFRIALILGCMIFSNLQSQSNKGEMAIYNIGLGSITAGVGALLHKKKNEKFGRVFLKGLAQGALGGYFVHESKNFVGKISTTGKLEYAWGAKLTNSIGISIIENASLNKNFWERWHLNIGFNRLELDTKDGLKFKYKILPVSLFFTTYKTFGNKFELSKSLRVGEVIFTGNPEGPSVEGFAAGATWANVIELNNQFADDASIISHELIHVFQYYDFNFVNSFLSKPINSLADSSSFFKKFNSIFYMDAQLPVFGALYLLENNNRMEYYDNFFETEAGIYSSTIDFIPIDN